MSLAVFRQSLQAHRATFEELGRLNNRVKLHALIWDGGPCDPGLITGSNAEALTASTSSTPADHSRTYWKLAFTPTPRTRSEDDNLWDCFKPVGRICRHSGSLHPLLGHVGDTADDDFWLMLLFHAAWSGPDNLAYTAFNEDISGEHIRPIERDRVRTLPRGLRSELSTNPFDASAALINVLIAETDPPVIESTTVSNTHNRAETSDAVKAANAGDAVTWQKVQTKLERLRDSGEAYTSQKTLAATLGCAQTTVQKAINKSNKLKAWMAQRRKGAGSAASLSDVVTDNEAQTTEADPAKALTHEDVEAAMSLLINEAREEERAKLNAMTDHERRAMAEAYYEHVKDDEPSPLDGGNRRGVHHHKQL